MPIPATPDPLKSAIGGDVLPIEDTTPPGTGVLSYAQGWPVLTGLPLEAGGIAPQREYFNAINTLVSQHLFFLQSGGVYPWRDDLNYLKGWRTLFGGEEYAALLPSGPDIPAEVGVVGPKPPAASPEYWKKTEAAIPIATTTVAGVSLRATPDDIAAKTDPNKTVSPADLAGLDGLPVGALLDLYGDDSAAPPGYLLCNGAAVTATYPELRAFGLARGWAVNANGDPLLPDAGGYFPRGWRTGQVIDSGRAFGTVQGDAIRNITGGFAPTGLDSTAAAIGAFTSFVGSQDYNIATRTGYGTVILFDASRVVPTASENRPANYTVTTWIKAYSANTNPGSIDLANLTNDIQSVSARTTALENRLGYTVLYPGGTEAAPATISANQRIVIDNPFAPAACLVLAQIYVDHQWVWSGHVTSDDSFYFTSASILGNQIVVQAGLTQIGRRGPVGGSPFTTPDYVSTAPYRVLVWRAGN